MIYLSYKRACLNCLTESGFRHSSSYLEIEHPFGEEKAAKEFNAIWKVKKSLIEAGVECEICSQVGCFDVWDLENNGERIYIEPDFNLPWSKFFIDKSPKGLEVSFTPIHIGSNIIALTFFEIILKVLTSIPSRVFITQDVGFFEASVFYSYEFDTAMFNSLRHMGLSIDEIRTSITTLQNEFKKDAGVSW